MQVVKLTINSFSTLDISPLSPKSQAELIVLLSACRDLSHTSERVGDEWTSAHYFRPLELTIKGQDTDIFNSLEAAKAHLKSEAAAAEAAKAAAAGVMSEAETA
jgi:hypothetical protein